MGVFIRKKLYINFDIFMKEIDFSKGYVVTTIPKMLLWQAQHNPQRSALSFAGKVLTYAELDIVTDNIANYLFKKGVRKGDVVALCLERSEDCLILPLSIAKVGAIYISIRIDTPFERFQYICQDAQIQYIISNKINCKFKAISDIKDFIYINTCHPEFQSQNTNFYYKCIDGLSPSTPFCIFYTSGSTGTPKGVLHTQGAVVCCNSYDCILWGLTNQDVFLFYSDMEFVLGLQIFMALMVGACVHVANEELKSDLHKLNSYLESNNITIMSMPTQVGHLFCSSITNKSLNFLFLAGGVMPKLENLPEYKIIIGYGSTECISASYSIIGPKYKSRNIGKTCKHARFRVVDKNGNLVHRGEVGELWISGTCVSSGYIGARKDYNDRFCVINGENTFKSGDYVQELSDGSFIYVGRVDDMVKLRGYRIELGEVESCVSDYPGIEQVCACIRRKQGKDHLCIFYTSIDKSKTICFDKLRCYLQEKLPHYMVPQYGVQISSMPINYRGKIDKDLLELPVNTVTVDKDVMSDKEQLAVSVIKDILLLKDEISVFDNFISLGGDSLSAIEMVGLLREYGKSIKLKQILDSPNIRSLADSISDSEKTSCPKFLSGSIIGTVTLNNLLKFNSKKDLQHFVVPELFESSTPILRRNVEKVLQFLVGHHDMLRAHIHGNYLYVCSPNDGVLYYLEESHVSNQNATTILSTIDLFRNNKKGEDCMLRTLIIHGDEKDYLLIDCNHLVSDSISKSILKEDFLSAYQSICDKDEIVSAYCTSSYQSYCSALKNYKKIIGKQEIEYWERVYSYLKTHSGYNRTHHSAFDFVGNELGEYYTHLFLKYFNSRKDEKLGIIITAIGRIISYYNSDSDFCIQVIRHGRNVSFFDDSKTPLVFDRTIGFFPTNFPLLVSFDDNEVINNYHSVMTTLDVIPNQGIGFNSTIGYPTYSVPDFCVDFLGEVRRNRNKKTQNNLRKAHGIPLGDYLRPNVNMGAAYMLFCTISKNNLKFQARYDIDRFSYEKAISILSEIVEEIKKIINRLLHSTQFDLI